MEMCEGYFIAFISRTDKMASTYALTPSGTRCTPSGPKYSGCPMEIFRQSMTLVCGYLLANSSMRASFASRHGLGTAVFTSTIWGWSLISSKTAITSSRVSRLLLPRSKITGEWAIAGLSWWRTVMSSPAWRPTRAFTKPMGTCWLSAKRIPNMTESPVAILWELR
jgi:hypothetical protein